MSLKGVFYLNCQPLKNLKFTLKFLKNIENEMRSVNFKLMAPNGVNIFVAGEKILFNVQLYINAQQIQNK